MTKIYLSLAFLFLSFTIYSQNILSGEEIARKAKSGEPIYIENATIRGVIDFTDYEEKSQSRKSSWNWWSGWGSSNVEERIITADIVFRNVKFQDEVLAYINDQATNWTYTASFEGKVVFENCSFTETAAFKYSTFEREVNFGGTTFREEANFKYAKFDREADFASTRFKDEGNFKYAQFDKHAGFQKSQFNNEANFKYAKFNQGLNFQAAEFAGLLNLKYAEISGSTNLKAGHIEDIDVKYTTIDGESAVSYLIKELKSNN